MNPLLAFNLVTLISGFGFFAFIFLIPVFTTETLNLSLTENGLVLAVFSLAIIAASPFWGHLSDRMGRRKIFLVSGYILFALTSFLHFYVQNLEQLLVLRFVQGIAFATTPMLTALFSDHFGAQAGKKFSAFSAANAVGWGIGSAIAGILAEAYGIRAVFAIVSIFPLIGALLIHFSLDEHRPHDESLPGESRVPGKIFYLLATIFTRQSMAMALWSIFPIYLKTYFVTSLSLIGLVSGVNMLVQPIFMLLTGRFGERIEKLQLVKIGIIGTIFTFMLYGAATDIVLMLLAQVLIALFWSFIFIGINLYIIEETPQRSRGKAFGYVQATFTSSAAIGPLLGGTLSDVAGMHQMIFIVSGLMLLSFPFLLRLQHLDRIKRIAQPLVAVEPVVAGKVTKR